MQSFTYIFIFKFVYQNILIKLYAFEKMIKNLNKIGKQREKSKGKKGPNKRNPLLQFNQIKRLKFLKQKFEVLPNQANYQICNQPQYLRIVTQILENITKIRLQQIQYIVGEESFKKILVQLSNLTSHKQIILSLLRQLLKGIQTFIPYVAGDLFQILKFMVQIDGLSISQVSKLSKESDLNGISKTAVSLSVFDLIQSIEKWYFIGPRLCELRDRYSKLKQALKKSSDCI